MYNLAFNFLVIIGVIIAFNNNYRKGLMYGFILLLVLPQYCGVKINDTLPVLTTHRLVLIIAFFFWIRNVETESITDVPFKRIFILLLISNTVTLFMAEYFLISLKRYLSFCLENFVVYIILVTSIQTKDQIEMYFLSFFKAICFLAALAILERYSDIRIIDYLPTFGSIPAAVYKHEVITTFPHPIFLGIPMAVGLTMCITLIQINYRHSHLRTPILYMMMLIIGSALYFSFSRGPWVAAGIGCGTLFLLSGAHTKRTVLIVLLIVVLINILRPGVFRTLSSYYKKTLDKQSIEGSSYYYRWELWRKAYKEIKTAPERMAFGYGLEYHRYEDLNDEFVLADKTSKFRSWDNEFAAILLELGFVGLFLYFLLYFSLFRYCFGSILYTSGDDKDFLISLIACYLICLFMMTNVKMFSSQVMFLFYTILSLCVRLAVFTRKEAHDKNMAVSNGSPL